MNVPSLTAKDEKGPYTPKRSTKSPITATTLHTLADEGHIYFVGDDVNSSTKYPFR